MKKASACCIFATKLFNPIFSMAPPIFLVTGKILTRRDTVTVDQKGDQLLATDWALKGPIQWSFTHVRPHLLKWTVKLQPEHTAIYRTAIIGIIWGPKNSKIQIFLIRITKTSRCGLGKKIPDFAFVQCSDMSTAPFPVGALLHKWFLQNF